MRKTTVVLLTLVLSMLTVSILSQQLKIAVVDPQVVIEKSKEGQRIKNLLQSFYDSKQSEINAKEAELKTLDEKIKDSKIAEDKKDELKSEFQQKIYQTQAFVKAAQEEMDTKSAKTREEFGLKLEAIIKKYAASKGFSLVLEKNLCLFVSDALDVSLDIVAEMDKAYPGK